jgi:hypothetical protein
MGSGNAVNDQRKAQGMDTSRKALELRRGGATYRQISDALNVSVSTAEKAVKRGLRMIVAEPAEAVLRLELDRLDGAWMGLWPRIQKGEPAAVTAGVRVIERRAKLLGLDAPKELAVDLGHTIDREYAQQLASDYGLDPEEVVAEAERHLRRATP